jgi:AraC-like DNA-binding protein
VTTALPSPDELRSLAHIHRYRCAPIAKKCGLCPRAFERHFRREIGEPPKRWINRVRMERAVELLRRKYSNAEIAFALGYWRDCTFCRAFQKFFGQSPQRYAARLRVRKRAPRKKSRLANRFPLPQRARSAKSPPMNTGRKRTSPGPVHRLAMKRNSSPRPVRKTNART